MIERCDLVDGIPQRPTAYAGIGGDFPECIGPTAGLAGMQSMLGQSVTPNTYAGMPTPAAVPIWSYAGGAAAAAAAPPAIAAAAAPAVAKRKASMKRARQTSDKLADPEGALALYKQVALRHVRGYGKYLCVAAGAMFEHNPDHHGVYRGFWSVPAVGTSLGPDRAEPSRSIVFVPRPTQTQE
jgi:hypothetical protein